VSAEIEVLIEGRQPLLRIRGGVVESDVVRISDGLGKLAREGQKTVVVDVTELSFTGSQGLGVIVFYHNKLLEEGRRLLILDTDPDPETYFKRLLRVTKLESVLTVVTDISAV
jgi:anti-anti-sigma factor